MAGRNIGKKYIIAVNRLIRCCFSSFCGVSTYKFNRYPSSQASADPTSDVHIVAFPFSIYCHLIPTEIEPKKFLRIMQGLRSLWYPLLMSLALLCDNKGPSVVCQQKFRTALTLKYLYGLSSFKFTDTSSAGKTARK